jgi:hypothetical protein
MVRSMPYHLHASNAQFQFAVWAACQWGFNGSPTDNAGLGTTIQLNSKQSKHIQGQELIARALPPITYRFHQPPARTCRGTGDPHRVGQPGLYLRAIMRHRLWGDDSRSLCAVCGLGPWYVWASAATRNCRILTAF